VLIAREEAAAALSVAVCHLIRLSFQAPIRIPATLYVFLFELCRRRETNRDVHVARVLAELARRRQIAISDLVNYPTVLLQRYGKTGPAVVCKLFEVWAPRNRTFFRGWLIAHERLPEDSKMCLRAVGKHLPRDLLEQFPRSDIEEGNDANEQLKLQNEKLFASSGRFLVILIVSAIIAAVCR
jgi:hypothetical protein